MSVFLGEMLPSDEITHMSFFAQQFLANSGHLSSKKYQQELDILNSTLSVTSSPSGKKDRSSQDDYKPTIFNMVSHLITNDESKESKEKKELKSRLADLERRLDEQLDATQVLQADASDWKWLEIIRLFELFLLEYSSLYPHFVPTRDAELFGKFKRKVLAESQKLIKVIKKLIDFFSNSGETGGNPTNMSTLNVNTNPILISHSPRVSNVSLTMPIRVGNCSSSTSSQIANEKIACVGCYLIDFCLSELEIENIAQNQFGSVIEFVFIQFLQSMRQLLLSEFPLNISASVSASGSQTTLLRPPSQSRISVSQTSTASLRSLGKESTVANYVLFLGHMSAHPKGDLLLEHFKIYDLLVKVVEVHRDVCFIKLLVSTLNYYTSPKSRVILERALCYHATRTNYTAYNELKIYTLKLILNLFRAYNIKFEAFFVHAIFKCLFWALEDDTADSPLLRYSNEQVTELAVDSLEYLFNMRPDLLDRVLEANDADELIRSVDEIVLKCGQGRSLTRSRAIRTKLELLSCRMKMGGLRLAKMSNAQVTL